MTDLAHSIDQLTVAVIGSFRTHYASVVAAIEQFESAGIPVVSPPKSEIRDANRPFVRFVIDPGIEEMSDHELQQRTLDQILQASCVYVVAPSGYIGRTTLLELGHVRQYGLPTFFSAVPDDLPIHIASSAVISATELAERLSRHGRTVLEAGHVMPGPRACGRGATPRLVPPHRRA